MKYLYLFAIATLFSAVTVGQQVEDIVTAGAGYENQIWYSMENGEVANSALNNWDLAFQISGFASSIRVNTQKGLFVYSAPYSINQWEDLEEFNPAWPQLYNDITNWDRGALNLHPTSDFDLGWGIYNPITHFVNGDSLYVVELTDGTLKKLRIDALASGVYTFTYANLDGSDEQQKQLTKSNFQGKNFGYFSFDTGETIDREPLSEDWDITFTRFTESVQGQSYPVTGVLHNYNVRTAEVSSTPIDEADPWQVGFVDEINQIGYDWKSFNFETGWTLEEDHSYFVESLNGNIYQIVFTGFGGSETGVYEFTTGLFSALGAPTQVQNLFRMYPNPSSSGASVSIEGEFDLGSRLQVFGLDGRLIHEEVIQTLNRIELNTNRMTQGTYLLRVVSNNQSSTQKLTVTN